MIGVWQRERLTARFLRICKALHPSDRVAALQLLRACRSHAAAAASVAWNLFGSLQADDFSPCPELHAAVLKLQRHHFVPAPVSEWLGSDLAQAFRRNLSVAKVAATHKPRSGLPAPIRNRLSRLAEENRQIA